MVEQAVADPNSGALADAPSSLVVFNNAGLVLAAIGFNLNRAAGPVASLFQAKATTAVGATTGEAAVGDSGIKALLPNSGALADAPSSLVVFNNAGLVLAAIGFNLNRAKTSPALLKTT